MAIYFQESEIGVKFHLYTVHGLQHGYDRQLHHVRY
jgi:hypothetical protein